MSVRLECHESASRGSSGDVFICLLFTVEEGYYDELLLCFPQLRILSFPAGVQVSCFVVELCYPFVCFYFVHTKISWSWPEMYVSVVLLSSKLTELINVWICSSVGPISSKDTCLVVRTLG